MLKTRSAIVDTLHNVDASGIFQKKKYYNIIKSLTTSSTFTVNYMEDNLYEYLADLDPTEFEQIIREGLYRSLNSRFSGSIDVPIAFRDLKIRLVSDSVEPMHKLNGKKHENTVVTFDCDIIASEKEKTYIKKCKAYCPLCGTDYDITADEDRKINNILCSNFKCKKTKLILKKTTMETENIQVIYLQEPMDSSLNNTPVIFQALLIGDLCGKVFIGQKKRITGIFKSQIDLKININDIVIEIISETDLEEKIKINISDDVLKKLKDEVKNPNMFISKITDSFAPLIIGLEQVKLSILLMLVGGNSTVKREDINMFLIGDPSMAKSELLKFCNKITDKSMYTSGKGASAAGLTIGLVKTEKGNYVAQAGVLPICSGGYAFIDEFDKMSPDDRSALHEAMEQQTVSIAKAGFRMTLPAKTAILAAANPKYGKYDTSQPIMDNIDIPLPLLSRFDMVWLIRDKVDWAEDINKANFILDTFTGDSKNNNNIFSQDELSSYISYVRRLKPILTKETKEKLREIYLKMRRASDTTNSIAVGTRQLEALVRMTMAHAKLLMKTETDLYDVECVEKIINAMFKEFNIDLKEKDPNYNMNTMYTTSKMSKEQLAEHIWTECKDIEGHIIYNTYIEKLSTSGKYDVKSAKAHFTMLERNCVIKHLGGNKWKKV